MKFRFRHLAATAAGMTFVLILLGVYTAAAGAGLSCGAQWPLCDGGLFPQSWPSFVEWFHRLFAMITGFVILGTTYAAWRHTDDRRLQGATALSLLVLPAQIVLGGLTVTVYAELIQVAHHAAALIIFGSLVAATAWAYDRPTARSSPSDTRQIAHADD
jgi:heme a synthase